MEPVRAKRSQIEARYRKLKIIWKGFFTQRWSRKSTPERARAEGCRIRLGSTERTLHEDRGNLSATVATTNRSPPHSVRQSAVSPVRASLR